MLGTIIGDICGSKYESRKWTGKTWDFDLFPPGARFTDDTVMTMAVARAIMDAHGNPTHEHFINAFHRFGKLYPHAGYGHKFREWLASGSSEAYGSFGNGGAMRVSPVAWAYGSLEDVEKYARVSSAATHDHPEGIKGAVAVAGAIFLARTGAGKDAIREYSAALGYDMDRKLAEFGPAYIFSSRAQTSVPEAIIAFLESADFESAIKNAIWLGGDCDTQAAIAGSIAEAFYGGVPEWMKEKAMKHLDDNLRTGVASWLQWLEMMGKE